MREREILISGAGVAGPLLAFWLARQGFRPTVVERAPALRDGGYKVDVRGTAVEVLKRTGVYDAARARDTGMRQVTYVRSDGRPIAALDANMLMGRRGDDIELMRGDLVRILHDAAVPATEFLYGDAIAAISDDGTVSFESGASHRYDVIVGADGLHSNTRRLAGLDAPLRHLGAYLSICTVPNSLRLDREEVFWTVPGRMIFLYSTGPDDPAKAGMVFTSPELPRAEVTRELVAEKFAGYGWEVPRLLESIMAGGEEGEEGEKDEKDEEDEVGAEVGAGDEVGVGAGDEVAGVGVGAGAMIRSGAGAAPAATPTPALGGQQVTAGVRQFWVADDFYVDGLSQVVLPRWSAGRVVLLGDAAFCPAPSSGQGTSMAIVGAFMLADALTRAARECDSARGGPTRKGPTRGESARGGKVQRGGTAERGGAAERVWYAAAFADYERAMRPYAEKNLILGKKMAGDMVPGGRASIAFRHYGMRTLRFNPWARQMIETVTKPIHEAANAIELPPTAV